MKETVSHYVKNFIYGGCDNCCDMQGLPLACPIDSCDR